jgi:hypothetical protein
LPLADAAAGYQAKNSLTISGLSTTRVVLGDKDEEDPSTSEYPYVLRKLPILVDTQVFVVHFI